MDGPAWVDPAWWEVYGMRMRDRGASRREWVNSVARAWCLVRREDSLVNVGEVLDQRDMADRLLGRKFYTVIPLDQWSWP